MIRINNINFRRFTNFYIQFKFLFVLHCSTRSIMIRCFILTLIRIMTIFITFLTTNNSRSLNFLLFHPTIYY
jgi:hypothetical protein